MAAFDCSSSKVARSTVSLRPAAASSANCGLTMNWYIAPIVAAQATSTSRARNATGAVPMRLKSSWSIRWSSSMLSLSAIV